MTKGLWCLAGGKNKQLTDVGRLGRDRNRTPHTQLWKDL